jgi:hypothetical protein
MMIYVDRIKLRDQPQMAREEGSRVDEVYTRRHELESHVDHCGRPLGTCSLCSEYDDLREREQYMRKQLEAGAGDRKP